MFHLAIPVLYFHTVRMTDNLGYLHHVAPGEAPELLEGVVLGQRQGREQLGHLPGAVVVDVALAAVDSSHEVSNLQISTG